MKHLWALLGYFLVTLLPVSAYADDVDKVLACMRANVPAAVRVQQVELISTDRSGGQRTLKGKIFAKSEATASGPRLRALLKMDAPADLAGAAYLVREAEDYLRDGMYIYLPSVRRVRRVSGTFADGALLGTNFSYNDFRQIQTAFVGASAQLEASEPIEDRDMYVLNVIPAENAKSSYSQVRVWADQKTCVVIKAEFRKGVNFQTLVKELTVPVSALKKSGARWYASEALLRDLTDGSSSQMYLAETKYDGDIPASYFDPVAFHLGK